MNHIRTYFISKARNESLNGCHVNYFDNNIHERIAVKLLNECQNFTMINGVGKAT